MFLNILFEFDFFYFQKLIFFGGINLKYIFDPIITTNEGIGFDKRQLVVVAQFCDPHVSNLSKTKYLRKRDLLFTQQVPLFLCVLSFNDIVQTLRAASKQNYSLTN